MCSVMCNEERSILNCSPIRLYDCRKQWLSFFKLINKTLVIKLKYFDSQPVIESLNRISKPSLRHYVSKDNMPSIMNGLGIVIVSTPKGVMTGQAAKAQNIGGEVLCSVS